MSIQPKDKNMFRLSVMAVALTAALGAGIPAAAIAEEVERKAHSDGIVAIVNDTAITAKVKGKLMGEGSLKTSSIDVVTTNGVVTLEGAASNQDAKSLAGDLARTIDGVKSVDNKLVTYSGSKTEAKAKNAVATSRRVMSDTWITTKVKSQVLADSVSKGFEINVDTRDGVVVLKGVLVSQAAIDHVKDIAAKVEGVKSVDVSALFVAGK